MYQQQQLAVAKIRENPNVAATMSFIGVGGSSQQMNLGRIVITLKPRSERPSPTRSCRSCGRSSPTSPA